MPRKKASTATPDNKPLNPMTPLRRSLSGRTKTELVAFLLELAEGDRRFLRQLTERFEIATDPEELADATRQAIVDATDFDPREMNRNFDYDYAAYTSEVQPHRQG